MTNIFRTLSLDLRFQILDFALRFQVIPIFSKNLQSTISNLQSAIMLLVPELLPGLRAWPGPGETALIF